VSLGWCDPARVGAFAGVIIVMAVGLAILIGRSIRE
jgi:hypothetical protein